MKESMWWVLGAIMGDDVVIRGSFAIWMEQ